MDSSISDISSQYDGSINTLLVTANVGSLFEDPLRLLEPWLLAFLQKVGQLEPKFLGLHLQEVGGKTYEKSMDCVQEFIKKLCNAPEMRGYEIVRIFLDEDFKSAEHFTALGNIYFIHKNLKNVRLWNFLTRTWDNAGGKDIYSGNIETIPSKDKSKFPQHFFPECKWSRKGFMRTRWDVNHTVFDLVNIHLFHDASNLAACEEFPSVYCKTRRRALVHTLERFHLDEKNGLVPFFVFGDFNFRCDVEGVVKELTKNLTAHRVQSTKSDNTRVHYRNSTGDNILTIGKKEFNHADHQLKFKEPWLKTFDRELEPLHDFLHEFVIEFPPTYPYEEDPEMPTDYMSTRCPSWCDRILMTPQAKHILDEKLSPNTYNVIGEDVCMGDHKPVYLHICIKPNQGTYRCCNCHYLKANHSPTHNISASTIIDTGAYSAAPDFCPHKNIVFNESISEFGICTKLAVHSTTSAAVMPSASYEICSGINEKHTAPFGLPYDDEKDNGKANQKISLWPPISINIIDTDSIPVCMCSQIPNTIIDVINKKSIESGICPRCQNIIMTQSTEARYCLISKRLVLSNNIIVNRIDTQHLNTYLDFSYKRQDPYTPESAESHSPCPDLNTSTSTSSGGCSPDADCRQLLDNQKLNVVSYGKNDDGERCIAQGTVNIICDESDKQRRGFVSPHQLKRRLEDLRLSCNQNKKYIDGGVAGDSDVEDIDEICPSNNVPIHQYSNRCLHNCCNIH